MYLLLEKKRNYNKIWWPNSGQFATINWWDGDQTRKSSSLEHVQCAWSDNYFSHHNMILFVRMTFWYFLILFEMIIFEFDVHSLDIDSATIWSWRNIFPELSFSWKILKKFTYVCATLQITTIFFRIFPLKLSSGKFFVQL